MLITHALEMKSYSSKAQEEGELKKNRHDSLDKQWECIVLIIFEEPALG